MAERDDVRRILADFEERLVAILEGAWDEWLELPRRGAFSARSRASIVFDFIKARALAEFDGEGEIHAIVEGQTVKFLFRDQALVRFKKANSKGIGSNIETQAVLQFVDPQLKIPDLLPEVYKIEICYTLDKLATKMESIAVTKRDRHRKIWSYPIERRGAPENVVLLPSRPPPSGGDGPPEVRPRNIPGEKPQTGE